MESAAVGRQCVDAGDAVQRVLPVVTSQCPGPTEDRQAHPGEPGQRDRAAQAQDAAQHDRHGEEAEAGDQLVVEGLGRLATGEAALRGRGVDDGGADHPAEQAREVRQSGRAGVQRLGRGGHPGGHRALGAEPERQLAPQRPRRDERQHDERHPHGDADRLTRTLASRGVEPLPVEDIHGARILAMLGDSVTTDHISPAGSIKADSPAGRYLQEHGVARRDFNSYGSRRGNHEVMMRGTFANIRIRNEMVPGVEGGMTRHLPDPEPMAIYDAAMLYKAEGTPLAVIAGKEYGSGSSRDWAAKGPRLLGIRVVIAESFERIHRSNLIGMGILPLEFPQGVTRKTLRLTGEERIDISNLQSLQPGATVPVTLTRADGSQEAIPCRCRIDTATELTYYRNDGILHYVIRNML